MKTILFSSLILMLVIAIRANAQNNEVQSAKPDQQNLYNDFFLSYGLGSIFYFADQSEDWNRQTSGTIMAGYSRTINHIINVGFLAAYENVRKEMTDNSYSSVYKYDNNYLQGIAQIKFRYLNKPAFSMYSGIGIGITMNNYTETSSSGTKNKQRLYPAGQMTLLGFRVGRSLAFFGEFGIGTFQIINAGISYKFGE